MSLSTGRYQCRLLPFFVISGFFSKLHQQLNKGGDNRAFMPAFCPELPSSKGSLCESSFISLLTMHNSFGKEIKYFIVFTGFQFIATNRSQICRCYQSGLAFYSFCYPSHSHVTERCPMSRNLLAAFCMVARVRLLQPGQICVPSG